MSMTEVGSNGSNGPAGDAPALWSGVGAVRQGRYTRIRPVLPDDYSWLYHTALHTEAGSRWRLHGEVPHFDQFLAGLLNGAAATFIIEDLDGRPLGMTQIWQIEQLSRHAQVTAFLDPAFQGRGWPLEGVALCADYAFRSYDLRKVYFETLETELVEFRSMVGGLLREEGRLRSHRYVFGQYVDLFVLALYRSDFDELLRSLGATAPVNRSDGSG